jgi:hypothetical protein
MTMIIFIVMTIRRNCFRYPVAGACRGRYRVRFLPGWLRTGSHQTPIGIKRSAMKCRSPWRRCRPRETLVPDEVQWVSEPWLLPAQRQSSVAHCLGDRSSASRRRSKRKTQSEPWLFTSRSTGLVPFAPPFNQSSGLSQMACAPEACDSRRAPACAPAP